VAVDTAGAQARHEEAAPAEGNFADRAPAVRAAGGIGDVLRGRTAARDPVQSKQWQRHLSRGDERGRERFPGRRSGATLLHGRSF